MVRASFESDEILIAFPRTTSCAVKLGFSLYSIFWPPKTPEQIQAFSNYAAWMANHFRGRVQYYKIWNEPNIDYWNPVPSPDSRRAGNPDRDW